ncbi:hypothetical protein STAS_22250 [Striga asiatica]|uniref:Uncharacterized protein n=1 Tax=Striga asiatica TaxID=4170 RepID=A0A5A7QJ31_STRAF|nr:hypothetical protein STAS_22250 [Striga asiatica]
MNIVARFKAKTKVQQITALSLKRDLGLLPEGEEEEKQQMNEEQPKINRLRQGHVRYGRAALQLLAPGGFHPEPPVHRQPRPSSTSSSSSSSSAGSFLFSLFELVKGLQFLVGINPNFSWGSPCLPGKMDKDWILFLNSRKGKIERGRERESEREKGGTENTGFSRVQSENKRGIGKMMEAIRDSGLEVLYDCRAEENVKK